MTGGLHISAFSRFKIKPENNLSRGKKYIESEENTEKIHGDRRCNLEQLL
jgi:hypothetical protein